MTKTLEELINKRKYPSGAANKIRVKLGGKEWPDEDSIAAIERSISDESDRKNFAHSEGEDRSGADIKKEKIEKGKIALSEYQHDFKPQPKAKWAKCLTSTEKK
jgi:hypothetical protein